MGEQRRAWPAWLEPALLAGVCALAVFLRFYRLADLPPGFHHDEAFEAVEALKVLAGGYAPVFFRGNFGVEPLLIYLTALAFKLFGVSQVVMRGVMAICGSLSVPALYWLGRELSAAEPRLPRRLGLMASAILAGLYWHVNFSRTGIEPALVPLCAILMAACLWRGLRRRSALWFALSGVCVGMGPYTYPAGRLFPFLLIAFIAYSWLFQRDLWRGQGRRLLILAGAALLVFLPLGVTWAREPDLLTLRSRQVAVMGEGAGSESAGAAILRNLRDTALGFSFAGDDDPRSNLPGRPLLDPYLSILFYCGLVVALWRWRRPAVGFLLLWLAGMLTPTILSEYAPHFRRAIGAAPAVALLMAWGAAALAGLGRRLRGAAPLLALILILGWAGSVALTARDYFVRWAAEPALFYAYDVGLADVAGRIAAAPADARIYLSPRAVEHPTLAFFLWGTPAPRRFDGREGIVLPPEGASADYWIIAYEDWRGPALIERHLPDAQIAEQIVDAQGRLYAVRYRQPAGGRVAVEPAQPSPAQFGPALTLLGWGAVNPTPRAGEVLYVDVSVQSRQPTPTDYTLFIHLLGEYNPATSGPVWAGADRQPCGGACPTSSWEAGERIVEQAQIRLPDDMPAGDYQIELGWYDLRDMGRLTLEDGADHLILGSVKVVGANQTE